MRFAITSNDRYLGVFDAFVKAGWKPIKLFTSPVSSIADSQHAVLGYAEQLKLSVQNSQITPSDLEELKNDGCDVLILAGYDWKLCDWTPYLKHAINFHASPLPEGRGPYPVMRAILENKPSWGISCHKVSQQFDKGDVLSVENFPLMSDECHESLDLKVQLAAKRLATRIAHNFSELWNNAQPQQGGSYWELQKVSDRVLDFKMPVASILRHTRAFGLTGTLANINNTWLTVKLAVGWAEAHNYVPGQVVHVFNRFIVLAAADGYVGLLDTELSPPSVTSQLGDEVK